MADAVSRPRPVLLRVDAPWLRLTAFVFALLVCVLLPFALWGEAMDRAAPQWLRADDGRFAIAALGIALLVLDVVLPIPSSVVAMALCWTLGPLLGGMAVALGMFAAFATGYGLGRLLPEARLRAWIGPTLWDRVQTHARQHAMWWIVLARPLPLLSEISALLAGVWRLPVLPAFARAAAASCVVGALYAASAWLGRSEPHPGATALALLALPASTWLLHRLVVRRLLSNQPKGTALRSDQETL
jgi:uncharacterized membrane protein YdjX (TVP38/TMEM64 family)